nr:uncharacterized protein LOC109186215 [Ipomoea batatas]
MWWFVPSYRVRTSLALSVMGMNANPGLQECLCLFRSSKGIDIQVSPYSVIPHLPYLPTDDSTVMSFLAWNCRGLGNPATVQFLKDLVHSKKPILLFLMETLLTKTRMEALKMMLGFSGLFVVDCSGHSGGLALLWWDQTMVSITSYSSNHIDAQMAIPGHPSQWRFTGFYGHPERHKRRDSWNLLEDLSSQSNLPWLLMGDFNDIRNPEEKRGMIKFGATKTLQQVLLWEKLFHI